MVLQSSSVLGMANLGAPNALNVASCPTKMHTHQQTRRCYYNFFCLPSLKRQNQRHLNQSCSAKPGRATGSSRRLTYIDIHAR